MAASNNNSSNNNINKRSLVGDNGQDDNSNNNSFEENPRKKKNINKADNGGLAGNNNLTTGSPDGEKIGGKPAALSDEDVVMEDVEMEQPPINDIVKAIQVALEGHNGEMARRYEDAVLRGYTAMFPDGTKNMFVALVGDTVKDANDKLDNYFGEDAVFLGFVVAHRVIRATPTSKIHDIVGHKHIKLGFGYGAETPDDGD